MDNIITCLIGHKYNAWLIATPHFSSLQTTKSTAPQKKRDNKYHIYKTINNYNKALVPKLLGSAWILNTLIWADHMYSSPSLDPAWSNR